jgi:hypothetical protein
LKALLEDDFPKEMQSRGANLTVPEIVELIIGAMTGSGVLQHGADTVLKQFLSNIMGQPKKQFFYYLIQKSFVPGHLTGDDTGNDLLVKVKRNMVKYCKKETMRPL